jgi:hypothetical protein
MPLNDAIDTIDSILKSYGSAIKQVVEAADYNDGMLTEDVSKHVKAYSSLVGTKSRLQKSEKQVPSNDYIDIAAFERRSKLVLEKFVKDDGSKMIRSADKLLKALEARCVKMEIDEESGRYKLV